jgi:glycosyltransferase involved in cell wall biosynthesis
MTAPLVSIVIPTYRRPRLLREALASAVGQTHQNLQIVVRDNASGDETPDVVSAFADPRIQFLQAGSTVSASENGLECLRKVRGKYFFFLSDDDRIDPDYIAVLVAELERDRTVMAAYGATYLMDEKGAVTTKCRPEGTFKWQAPDLIRAWCAGRLPLATGVNFVCPSSFIRARNEAPPFVNGHNADNATFIMASIQGKVLFTDKTVFYYRKHSLNSERSSRYQDRIKGDEEFLAYVDQLVSSASNVSLPKAEWPRLRADLVSLLASNYYGNVREYHLKKENVWNLIRAAVLCPVVSYGVKNSLKYLRGHYPSLAHAIASKFVQTSRQIAAVR